MEGVIFKNDAKSIVDLLFDSKLFKDDLTRDNMNSIEDCIQFMMQSRFESYKKIHTLKEDMDLARRSLNTI